MELGGTSRRMRYFGIWRSAPSNATDAMRVRIVFLAGAKFIPMSLESLFASLV